MWRWCNSIESNSFLDSENLFNWVRELDLRKDCVSVGVISNFFHMENKKFSVDWNFITGKQNYKQVIKKPITYTQRKLKTKVL